MKNILFILAFLGSCPALAATSGEVYKSWTDQYTIFGASSDSKDLIAGSNGDCSMKTTSTRFNNTSTEEHLVKRELCAPFDRAMNIEAAIHGVCGENSKNIKTNYHDSYDYELELHLSFNCLCYTYEHERDEGLLGVSNKFIYRFQDPKVCARGFELRDDVKQALENAK